MTSPSDEHVWRAQLELVPGQLVALDQEQAHARLDTLLERGWSMRQLATTLEVNPSTVSRWAKGADIPGPVRLILGAARGAEDGEEQGQEVSSWLTLPDAARLKNLSREGLRGAILRGDVRAIKLGGTRWRVDPDSLRDYDPQPYGARRVQPAPDQEAARELEGHLGRLVTMDVGARKYDHFLVALEGDDLELEVLARFKRHAQVSCRGWRAIHLRAMYLDPSSLGRRDHRKLYAYWRLLPHGEVSTLRHDNPHRSGANNWITGYFQVEDFIDFQDHARDARAFFLEQVRAAPSITRLPEQLTAQAR